MLSQLILIFKTVTGFLGSVAANFYSNIQSLFTLPVVGFLLLSLTLLNFMYSARLASDYLGNAGTRTAHQFKQLIQLVNVLLLIILNVLAIGQFELGFLVLTIFFILYCLYIYNICFFEFVYYNSCPTLTGYSISSSCYSERRIRGFKNIKKNRATKSFSTLSCSSKEIKSIVVYKPVVNAITVFTKENKGIQVIDSNAKSLAIVPYVTPVIFSSSPYLTSHVIGDDSPYLTSHVLGDDSPYLTSHVLGVESPLNIENVTRLASTTALVPYVYNAYHEEVLNYNVLGFLSNESEGSKLIWEALNERAESRSNKRVIELTGVDFVKTYGVLASEIESALETVELTGDELNKNLRCITFKFDNDLSAGSLSFMYACLHMLFKNKEFLGFGHNKAIMSTGYHVVGDSLSIYSLHKNVLLNNSESAATVLSKICRSGFKAHQTDEDYYWFYIIKSIHIQVWNLDLYSNRRIKINKNDYSCTDLNTGEPIKNSLVLSSNSKFNSNNVVNFKRGLHTTVNKSIYKNEIGSLKPSKSFKSFGTVDIETVNINGQQIPMCISACYDGKTHFFIVDKALMHTNQKEAVQNMFNDYFEFLIKQESKTTFYHNLGRFDGRFIFECLIRYAKKEGRVEKVDCLMDASKSFINISYAYNDEFDRIIFQDSLRLFGVSLKKLCSVYNVEGKISDYNMEFNKLDILDNTELLATLEEYSLQDSKCLYDALLKAQSIYFDNYSIDIVKVLSTASLSMKIFRTHYLKNPIPILNGMTDQFIRQAYFGGANDCYHKHGKDLYYYDVNSLYPHVMKKKMPTKVIKRHPSGDTINIENFFGYISCVVHAPDNIKNPIIPFRTKNRTIYPTGKWEGVYFSEMIKEAYNHGYKFEFIKGIEFEGEYIFTDYIDHFYKIKSEAKANGNTSLTFLAKMHLNQLYGVFGRKNNSISTIIVEKENIEILLMNESFSSILEIDDDLCVVLLETGESAIESNRIAKYTSVEGGRNTSNSQSIKSNVAIAAAVTAYGQIEMMKFKNNTDYTLYYTDTDSIFIDKPLPTSLIGNALGQLKNETMDKYGVETINEAYFLGVKKYGYRVDKDGSTFDSSVFAGVQRDSISLETIEKISNGENHTISQPSRLYNSTKDFSIIQKDSVTTTITKEFHKNLIGNFYKPIKLT